MYSDTFDKLYQIAEAQAGYFTTAQAGAVGVDRNRLAHYAAAGHLERVQRGVYRLVSFPRSAHEDLFIAWLATGPDAVISHDSALTIYDLSDVLPAAIHVTVPRTASRRRPGLRLHTNRITPEEITHYDGLPVTTVPRTIADVATLEMFVSIMGTEAGNLALKLMATGGVYLGGGIPPRILPALATERFKTAFCSKGRLSEVLEQVPVHVILNPKVALLGAACHGLEWPHD